MGVAASTTYNELENIVNGSIQDMMESTVDGSAGATCTNAQLVKGARNCDITFAKQVCRASVISNMTSNVAMESQISQDIMADLRANASSSVEGLTLQLAQVSDSSNIIRNVTNVAMTASKAFTTTCTRNFSALNEQSVRDCDSSRVAFAEQDASGEVVGDCVATHVGSSTASQSLATIMDAEATATTKGVDLWALVMMLGGFVFLFVLGVPAALFALRYAATKRVNGQTAQDKEIAQRSQMRFRACAFILFAILVSCVVWWPGVMSIYLGISPWPYIGVQSLPGRETLCVNGRNMDPEAFMSPFAWYDPYCLASGSKSCTEDDKLMRYRNCGLFADVAGCDDPEFVRDRAAYEASAKACAAIATSELSTCSAQAIGDAVFFGGDDKKVGLEGYADCTRCTGRSDAEEASGDPLLNFGLWVRNGASCATGVSHTAYLKDGPCSFGEGRDCFEKEEDFVAASPNECRNKAYQLRKSMFSRMMRQCAAVQASTRVTTAKFDGETPPLRAQCPPDPFDFFTRCDRSTKVCAYRTSSTNVFVQASCRNDYSVCCSADENGDLRCMDPDYQKDFGAYTNANEACKKRHESRNYFNPWGWAIPLALYLLGLAIVVYITLRDPGVRDMATQGVKNPKTRKTWNRSLMIFGLFGVLVFGWPVGIGAITHAGGTMSVYDRKTWDFMDSFDPEDYKIVAYVGTGISGAIFLVQAVRIGMGWAGKAAEEEEAKDQKMQMATPAPGASASMLSAATL